MVEGGQGAVDGVDGETVTSEAFASTDFVPENNWLLTDVELRDETQVVDPAEVRGVYVDYTGRLRNSEDEFWLAGPMQIPLPVFLKRSFGGCLGIGV